MAKEKLQIKLRRVRRTLWIGGILGFILGIMSPNPDILDVITTTGVGALLAGVFLIFTEKDFRG